MRIRKRFPPNSGSSQPSLSADPQPQLNRSVLVVVVQHENNPCEQQQECKTNLQQTDPPLNQPFPDQGSQNTTWVFPAAGDHQEKLHHKVEVEDDDRWEEELEELGSNDISKGRILKDEPGSGVLHLQPSSSSEQLGVGRWGEGDKVVPLKKRKGRFERNVSKGTTSTIKPKMNSKTNKKCHENISGDQGMKKKGKTKRGSVIMEGSRCSRVNGRGWRCCQQTLVGYSLCEHHLGKGRLRSITSVRNRAATATTKTSSIAPAAADDQEQVLWRSLQKEKQQKKWLPSSDHDSAGVADDEDDKVPLMVTKRRMKLGLVKARSMSSLLGQSTDAAAAPATPYNKSFN